jgi:hypothetical protein
MHIYRPVHFAVGLSIVAAVLCVPPLAAADNAGETGAGASSAMSAAPPDPRPADKMPSEGAWPFAPWSYAKAYTFNFFHVIDAPRGTPLTVVGRKGEFSRYVHSEQLIPDGAAMTAAKLVDETRGSFVTAKCNFPRHAIVLFDKNDKPVASANICFECDGTIIWPDYQEDKKKDFEEDDREVQLRHYEAVISKWKRLFGDKIGVPLDY